MKKIGLFLEAEPVGGGVFQYSQAVIEAISSLPKDKFCVVVFYTSKSWQRHLSEYKLITVLVDKGFLGSAIAYIWRKFGFPTGMWRKICRYFYHMAKAMINEGCDLWVFPSQDAASYQIPVPALTSIHDLMHRYERQFPEVSAKGEYRLRELHYKNICKWTKGILVDSEVGKRHVMESYSLAAERIHVLPYIAPAYMYSYHNAASFDSRYQLPEKFIFYPAQFWEHKNHNKLIDAVGRLKQDLPDLKLVLVGSKKNGYESALKTVQEQGLSENIFFLGYVPDTDMPELYRRARALVMPTFFGPTNIPPLEAFVAGCPVAISGIYGIPEQVGDAALLFHPESIGEIAESIKRLWTDDELCAELAEKGRRKAAMWGQKQFNNRLREIIEKI